LARLGGLFAQANHGELFALNVIRVPPQLGVTDGRAFLRQGRPILEEVVGISRRFDIPVRTMLRLGRDVAHSIIDVAQEREASLLLLGWPGYTQSKGQAFGSVIDLMTINPPCDLAVARLRQAELPASILVPIAGGPNARLALELALTQADAIEQRTGNRPKVVALNLIPKDGNGNIREQRRKTLLKELEIEAWPIELRIVPADDVVQGILTEAANFEQIIIGASEERILEQSLFGSIPQRVAEEALTTVIMVKHYDPVKFGVRRWLMRPRRASVSF
jgi:nucleotide-binding universal stress UspA family protein